MKLVIDKELHFHQLEAVINNEVELELSAEAKARITHCRTYLEACVADESKIYYGINTGFGSLCNVHISNAELSALQSNLVQSHACGMGEILSDDLVRLILVLKIQSLGLGHSGIQLATVLRLVDFYNSGVYPVIYAQGSLGASGDLSPLAHLSLPLIGLGQVRYQGVIQESEVVLQSLNLEPLSLGAKEGLALLNGTQFMSALGAFALIKSEHLLAVYNTVAGLSLDAFNAKLEPFHALIHQVRPHKGQVETAEKMLNLLEDSEIQTSGKKQVQDPYSFRCIPQVHGASADVIRHVQSVYQLEINSVSDNPNIFPDEDLIISGGNFHGQPLAMAADYLAIALSELSNISERRIYQLISGLRDLPSFLVAKPGLNSGFMIPQYTAASIVSQNKQLCSPASVDSIVSSNGQEDHVSMGANAVWRLLKIVENCYSVAGIELFTAAQALEFRRPMKSSTKIENLIADYRTLVPFVSEDKVMYTEMQKSVTFLKQLIC